MKYAFKMMVVVLALGVLVLQGCQTNNYRYSSFPERLSHLLNENRSRTVSVSDYSIKDICDISRYNPTFKEEAKRRGLDCGFANGHLVTTISKSNNISPYTSKTGYSISNLDNDRVCFMSTENYKWSKKIHLQVYIQLAKRRGLDCGIGTSNKTVIASKPETKVYTQPKSNISSAELDASKREAKELRKKLVALEKKQKEQQQLKPKTVVIAKPKSEFPNKPIQIKFPSTSVKRDDIAVIIGNANYKKQGKDIPNVNPAYADAEGIKQYFMEALGIKEGNIIYLKDATAAQLLGTFGDSNSHKGQLYNWVKPQVSNVYVYYAGHGVPGGDKGNAYLVPTDADSQTIQFSGYPLSTLYSNLGKLSAKSITVILEACFSGASQAGNLFANSSPIVITAKKTMIPKNVKVISAGAVDQMASWEKDKSHGLFTKYFLKAMSGEGDKNNDGKVSDSELKNYLGETMTYYARRYYGRDQNVQIMQGN